MCHRLGVIHCPTRNELPPQVCHLPNSKLRVAQGTNDSTTTSMGPIPSVVIPRTIKLKI